MRVIASAGAFAVIGILHLVFRERVADVFFAAGQHLWPRTSRRRATSSVVWTGIAYIALGLAILFTNWPPMD
jgi:hypothetical protein